ncbi:hypothetical protein JCM16303_006729 [Sporobolomyces ruberrimus]
MSRSPSPWGQRTLAPGSPASSSALGASPASARSNSLLLVDGESESHSSSPSSSRSSLVHSTVPPSKPQLPPSPRTAHPITPSILLNPIPQGSTSPTSPSTASSILKRLPGKRRQSVVVEVVHSPPPAHFFQDQEISQEERVGRTQSRGDEYSSYATNMSPPRPDLSGMRSRSASPSTTPRSASPNRSQIPTLNFPSTSPSSNEASSSSAPTPSFVPLSSIISNRSTSSNASSTCSRTTSSSPGGQSIRFAPLPPGKSCNRANNRSNSISLGVASRARMINAQGGQPNMQQARYAGPLQWYEGGDMPPDVYTWRDAQRGISKIWKKVNGGTANGKEKEKERSNSLSSTTSGGSLEEAKRMEREAKSASHKGEVEHVEIVEPERTIDEEDEEGGEEDLDTESEVTAPRTPPEGSALGLTNVGVDDVELEKERRRREKGKGKQIVNDESGPISSRLAQVSIAQ